MAFLALFVGVAGALRAPRLGFYSDDWAFLGLLRTAGEQSLLGLVGAQIEVNANLALRPTQAVLQATLYRLFGVDPLGYHVFNLCVLVALTALLYAVVIRLALPRAVALSICCVYLLVPSWSSAQIWFAAFGYQFSLTFLLVGLLLDFGAVEAKRRRWALLLKTLSLAAMTIAAFGYEVVLPLFLLAIVATERRSRRAGPGPLVDRYGRWIAVLYHGATVAVAVAAVLYKAQVAEGAGMTDNHLTHVLGLVIGIGTVHGLSYGVGLPYTAAWSAPVAGSAGVAVGLLTLVAVALLVGITARRSCPTDRGAWPRLAASGLLVLLGGYAIFVTTTRIGFSSTGTSNRVGAAGAIGAALLITAVIGMISGGLPRAAWSRPAFAVGVAAVCAAGMVVHSAIAKQWSDAWRAQQSVLRAIEAHVDTLPPGSMVLLHGVCPYVGPAVVFEAPWDVSGALQVASGRRSLRGDVLTDRAVLGTEAVFTRIYGQVYRYPYDDRLHLLDGRDGQLIAAPDRAVVVEVVTESRPRDCEFGVPGVGNDPAPLDVWNPRLRDRLIRYLPWS